MYRNSRSWKEGNHNGEYVYALCAFIRELGTGWRLAGGGGGVPRVGVCMGGERRRGGGSICISTGS